MTLTNKRELSYACNGRLPTSVCIGPARIAIW